MRQLINRKLRAILMSGGELPPWVQKHIRRDYICRCALAAPPWVRRKDFDRLYEERESKSATSGRRHVIDHIVPITHPAVCGLTVPWNMQVIDYIANARKSNSLNRSMQVEMFSQPEQLRISI